MKNIKLFIVAWVILLSLLITISSMAQTDNYSCNVICLNKPDHVMEGATVNLFQDDQLVASTTTDSDGYFNFDNLLIGESYTAKFEYNAEDSYVDMEDVFQLLLFLWGAVDFNEIQYTAADVDESGTVNYTDFMITLVDHYIMQQPFPSGNFILPDWEFELDGLKATGGPAGGIAKANIDEEEEEEKAGTYIDTYYSEIIETDQNNIISVPVSLDQEITTMGAAIHLEFNEDLFDVINVESTAENFHYNVNGNQIRTGWTSVNDNDLEKSNTLLTVNLKQKQETPTSQIERLEIIEGTHVLNAKGKKISFLSFESPEFKTSAANSLAEVEIFPNPCTDYFQIQLADDMEKAELNIYNSLGQLVKSQFIDNSQITQINIQGLEKGTYFYHIYYQSKSITGPLSIR